ncbi:hypothetical protein ACFYXQ_12715 [Nocardia jiangxiensis]|uniref:Transposase n=1 Tax=Nocardia jiangxiensis TaxID=282685 RepID=A0ABW6S0C2_9NOCA
MGLRTIAKELGIDRKTARRFAAASDPEDVIAAAISRAALLDDFVQVRAVPALQSFVTGLEPDFAAVTAGLTLPWSNGPVEGTVHKIKHHKRQCFGRQTGSSAQTPATQPRNRRPAPPGEMITRPAPEPFTVLARDA